jgi:TatD DNase family protein
MKVFDAHIHFDKYAENHQNQIIKSLASHQVEGLITVSTNLSSCKENFRLASNHPDFFPAFGFHPEQPMPAETEVDELLKWISGHQEKMVAVGEVGLPYYRRLKDNSSFFSYEGYVEILEQFILLTMKLDKPIILHAVYEDARIVCGLLESTM